MMIRAMDIHNVPDIMALTLLAFVVARRLMLYSGRGEAVHAHGRERL